MREAADILIAGTVIKSETELRHDLVFTKNYIQITNIYDGNAEINTVIPVLQTGGTYMGYTTPEISDAPLLKVGKNYKLYLILSEYSKTYGQYYLICGGYQGAAEIVNNSSLVPLSDDNILILNEDSAYETRAVTNTPTYSYYWNKSSLKVYVQGDIRDRYHANTRTGICNGINAWHNSTDSPTTTITLSTVNADVCVYMYDYGITGWDGLTETSHSSNICSYSRITINSHSLTSYYKTTNLWQALTCHEFGHTLGLKHNTSSSSSIMRPSTLDYYNYEGLLPKWKVPKKADINPINAKY